MQALILAGGLGTRLRSIVPDQPKVLAPVSGRPFIDYQLSYLKHQGVKDVILCIGYLGEQVESWVGDGQRLGLSVRYVQEQEQLGTAGAIRNVLDFFSLDDYFVVLNGDTYLEWSLEKLHTKHRITQADFTILLTPDPNPATATVQLAGDGRVVNYAEKVADSTTGYASAGVYIINRDIVEDWPTGQLSLEHDCFPKMVSTKRVYGEVVDTQLYDIGTPAGIKRFENLVTSGQFPFWN